MDAMADESQAADAQVADDAPAQAADSTEPITQDETSQDEASEAISLEAARKLRSENKNLRDRLKEFEDANKSELEKLQDNLATLQSERDTALTEMRHLRAQAALAEAGALHPDLLTGKLPDAAFEDAKAMERAVADLRKSYPSLFRSPNGSADGAADGNSDPARDINSLIREMARQAT